jgi:hypothetical protein
MDTLLSAKWKLEIERPAILSLSGAAPLVTVDGVQGWHKSAARSRLIQRPRQFGLQRWRCST